MKMSKGICNSLQHLKFLVYYTVLIVLFSSSNVGHPFAAGVTLDKLSAFTVDNNGNETFVTGGSLDNIQKVCVSLVLEIRANWMATCL